MALSVFCWTTSTRCDPWTSSCRGSEVARAARGLADSVLHELLEGRLDLAAVRVGCHRLRPQKIGQFQKTA
jgi:hypothetical protein